MGPRPAAFPAAPPARAPADAGTIPATDPETVQRMQDGTRTVRGADAGRPRRWHTVCELAELADPGARGFVIAGDAPLHGFLVRKGGRVYAYVNACPHEGRMLHWKPDAFLSRDGRLVLCSAHGAAFEIETGLCVGGPCPGAHLRPVMVRVTAGGLVDAAGE
jgi:nitrite reductase/ring-hydroxylating ferredoxin subunit